MTSWWLNVAIAALTAALVSPPAFDPDSLATAKSLYAAAEYEAALAMLDRLTSDEIGAEVRTVAEHRAFCLLALGRAKDAESAIAMMVGIDPMYQPSSDLSPRLRNAFRDVRRRLLPEIAQQKYGIAKAAFAAAQFAEARDAFGETMTILNDPELGEAAQRPPLSELRVLAAGFRDLSAASIPPPPIPAREQPAVVAAPPVAVVRRIYTAEDRTVVPPVARQQKIPPFPVNAATSLSGVLELLIDESGAVESAVMRVPIQARFDGQLVDAARSWVFTPATLDGTPVKYRRLVQIAVTARQ